MASEKQMPDRDKLIICACRASANVLARRGFTPEEIANGMISFGGAVAIEAAGIEMAEALFRSKADGLGEKIQ